jgi:aspartyl-tRNA(Asn)/glutamyl-tRNA(Gln) amidotransferase subunit A
MMTTDLTYSDATGLAELIRSRQVSSAEVVRAHLERIEAINPKLNAVVTLADGALDAAKAADEGLAADADVGPLHGVPFTVKDSFDTAGVLTQRGSPIFRGRVPDVDSTAVARMKNAGAILLAKTNLPEFSYSIETDNLLTGRANNPWNLDRTPGGSSGGDSAAIAAGMSPFGLGSDLAISVRGPAAHTGIAALKATHGRIPMTGVWPRVPRRDWHVGPMARTVRDLALTYSLLAGPDGADGFATTPAEFDTGVGFCRDRPLRVGWLVDSGLGPIDAGVAATVRNAAAALEGAGVVVESVRMPAFERDNPLQVFYQQHVMEVKPAFREVTAGHEDEMFAIQGDARRTRHRHGGLRPCGAGDRAASGRLRRVLPAVRRAPFACHAYPGPRARTVVIRDQWTDGRRRSHAKPNHPIQPHRSSSPVNAVRHQQRRDAHRGTAGGELACGVHRPPPGIPTGVSKPGSRPAPQHLAP